MTAFAPPRAPCRHVRSAQQVENRSRLQVEESNGAILLHYIWLKTKSLISCLMLGELLLIMIFVGTYI